MITQKRSHVSMSKDARTCDSNNNRQQHKVSPIPVNFDFGAASFVIPIQEQLGNQTEKYDKSARTENEQRGMLSQPGKECFLPHPRLIQQRVHSCVEQRK